MQEILEVLKETAIDSIKLLPFLFITYLIMEYIEHKTSNKVKQVIQKSGKFGPLLGGIVGIVPQCGFSVSATNLYSARVITLGTLISVYLTTSDEMLPILISETMPASTILTILGIKLVIGVLAGFIIDFVARKLHKEKEETKIEEICEHEHCHCEKNIALSALKHTLNIFLFIFIITLVINGIIEIIGQENLANIVRQKYNIRTYCSRNYRVNSKLCIISSINRIICRKCYINANINFRIMCKCRCRIISIIQNK